MAGLPRPWRRAWRRRPLQLLAVLSAVLLAAVCAVVSAATWKALCPKAAPAPPVQYLQYNATDIFDEQFRALSCHLADGHLFPNVTEADFLRDNLDDDMAPWQGGGFTFDDFKRMAELHPEGPEVQMLEVKNNTLRFVRRLESKGFPRCGGNGVPNADWWPECSNIWNERVVHSLAKGMAEGEITLPDTVFILNVNDVSFCADPGFVPGQPQVEFDAGGVVHGPDARHLCPVPMMTLFKERGERGLMVPEFQPGTLSDNDEDFPGKGGTPWSERKAKAFFRGSMYCHSGFPHRIQGRDVPCSRAIMRNVSFDNIEYVDAWSRTTQYGDDKPVRPEALPESYVDVGRWRDYKYLINLDGTTGSSRLFKILPLGSVVLKQESRWQQWYYRSMRACKHYVPIWHRSVDDIVDVVKELRKPENDAAAQRIASTADDFARQFLTRSARLRYWQAALERYATLFKDYDASLNMTELFA